jgi:hypothetical protein
MFKAELDELDIQKPIQGLLENNPKEEGKTE